jgi:uncharacterized protein YcaQ
MPLLLSSTAARHLMVAAQGLDRRPSAPVGKDALLATIRRLALLQIDTIHVVARSPYLVLYSRLGPYEPQWLDDLLAEGALFEYRAHAACFLPIEDYSLYRSRMLGDGLAGWHDSHPYLAAHHEEAQHMLDLIRERGPVRSADFQRRGARGSGWWDWKPEKRLLEALFNVGELMVARRESFQRVYDLRERVLPGWDDDHLPTEAEVRRALLLKAARALGVALPRWIAGYFYLKEKEPQALLEKLAGEGALLRAAVDGWDEPAYIHPQNAALAEAAQAGDIRPELTTLLSPFDPLISDRVRASAAFGFDYTVECYLPAAKRRYGYFCLPILRRGELIGRLDAKAHRSAGLFEVKALCLEPGVAVTDSLVADLAAALTECAGWHGTPEVTVRASDPPVLAGPLQEAAASI